MLGRVSFTIPALRPAAASQHHGRICYRETELVSGGRNGPERSAPAGCPRRSRCPWRHNPRARPGAGGRLASARAAALRTPFIFAAPVPPREGRGMLSGSWNSARRPTPRAERAAPPHTAPPRTAPGFPRHPQSAGRTAQPRAVTRRPAHGGRLGARRRSPPPRLRPRPSPRSPAGASPPGGPRD